MIASAPSRLHPRILRRFALQGLFVLAAAGAAVTLLAAGPERAPAPSASVPAESLISWAPAIAPDGKLQQRHGVQPQQGRDLAQLFRVAAADQAALAMPLRLDWSRDGVEQPAVRAPQPRVVKRQPAESVKLAGDRRRELVAAAEPPTLRPPEPAERGPAENPGVLETLKKPLTATVAGARGLVSGAAGAVGAAGAWTVAQAAGLLPRW